jgi:hypothetical protein
MSHAGTVKRVFHNKRAQFHLSTDDSVMTDEGESDE